MSEEDKKRWKYQRYIKDYLRVVRGLDDGVGRLVDYLKRENLYSNTVIIYAVIRGFFWARTAGLTNAGSMKNQCGYR